MNRNNLLRRAQRASGFTLPAVLVIVAALLILVIGLLAVTGIERRTARSYVDLQRADMAARAGLEEVKGILDRNTANDDFLVVPSVPPIPDDGDRNLEKVPYLYIARGETSGGSLKYKYHPLFSTQMQPGGMSPLLRDVPDATDLVGADPVKIETMPFLNPAYSAWVPIKGTRNGKETTVARYSYWVEDLQGKVNPKVAGNDKGTGDVHARNEFPFPAPGINPEPLSEEEPALSGIALYALDQKSTDKPTGDLARRVIEGRKMMISPGSILGSTGFTSPIDRGNNGLPTDPIAAALEKDTSPVIQPYEERPTIPFTPGINIAAMGQSKVNLNRLLTSSRNQAINEFAAHIDNSLPNFVERQGGFKGNVNENIIGDDYLKTLAANALDYADTDNDPTLEKGVYRGLDAYPMLSELVLKIEYLGHTVRSNRLLLQFRFGLYGELWNMTNQPVSGNARLSYEVALPPEGIGSLSRGTFFDDRALLNDKTKSDHDLVQLDGKFYSKEVAFNLVPDEYRFEKFASVTYRIDVGPNNISYNTPFTLVERLSEARGISYRWNNQEVDRISKIVRDPEGMKFTILFPRETAKAAIPGHSYGPYGEFVNNMGDPRMSHYLRKERLGENSFPSNISPNRRNIRRGTIYDKGGTSAHYGRVMPSEWPDRGHDSPYGDLPAILDPKMEPSDQAKFKYTPERLPANAPQRISNAGRFFSATELGHVYDPIMWTPHYDDTNAPPGTAAADTTILIGGGMPGRRNAFPDVTEESRESTVYGGGNTLRIGRYEHSKFDLEERGMRAAYLVDLFHAGKSTSDKQSDREGDVIDINGQININTASKDALRVMAAGMLKQDPELREITKWPHQVSNGRLAPESTKIELGTPTRDKAADVIADAIILRRPFASMGQLAGIRNENEVPVFGNPKLYLEGKEINWSDSAAEEVFARIHDAGTFRSRNFRVWVIGQSLGGSEANPEVLAETRKVFTVFADPGERSAEGTIKVENNKSRVTYENNF